MSFLRYMYVFNQINCIYPFYINKQNELYEQNCLRRTPMWIKIINRPVLCPTCGESRSRNRFNWRSPNGHGNHSKSLDYVGALPYDQQSGLTNSSRLFPLRSPESKLYRTWFIILVQSFSWQSNSNLTLRQNTFQSPKQKSEWLS